MTHRYDQLWLNANLFTIDCNSAATVMPDACLAVTGDRITLICPMRQLSAAPEQLAASVHDARGGWVTPGLIDCHTHVVYAGDRSMEYRQRLQGKSYAAIAEQGGGIQATVRATRQASEEQLLRASIPRVRAMLAQGVTTLEIKSGYGLDLAAERKILRVARQLAEVLPVRVVTTFLGAHVTPPAYRTTPEAYVDLLCQEMLPQLAEERLVDAVDVFCDDIAFSIAQTERIFQTAKALSLPIKCHAEQLSHQGAASLAARYHALSCDHLEYARQADVTAMAQQHCVAVLLPGAYYFLQAGQKPPLALLRQYRVPMALATDCNPGTSPTTSLLLMTHLAQHLWGMSTDEVLLGVTRHAASALGMADSIGSLQEGHIADFVIWQIEHLAQLSYYFGYIPPHQTIKGGVPQQEASHEQSQ
jgi:imidazolonepropionase